VDEAGCTCVPCIRAGVSGWPLRFVPSHFDDGSEERAFNPVRGVVQLLGHWAHGDELAAWYASRDAAHAACPRGPLRSALSTLLAEREPGEEG
jgi:hypothetical protein